MRSNHIVTLSTFELRPARSCFATAATVCVLVLFGSGIELRAQFSQTGDVYVDSNCPNPPGNGSVQNPFCTIGDAMAAVSDGATIIVLPGTYQGTNNRDIEFDKQVTLRGQSGDPTDVVILCNGFGRGFVFRENATPLFRLEAVSINFGFVSGADSGGGILIAGGGDPTIVNCRFHNCEASGNSSRGGAIAILSNPANPAEPVIENCTFDQNEAQAGGAIWTANSKPSISRCEFVNNAAESGGAIWTNQGFPIANSSFWINDAEQDGGAVFHAPNGDEELLEFRNCLFGDNFAFHEGGAVYAVACPISIVGCSFGGNRVIDSGSGGALYAWLGDIHVENSVFWDNKWNFGGDAVTLRGSDLFTIFSNWQSGITLLDGATITFGGGNLSEHPLWNANYLLANPNSPCIDSGNPFFQLLPRERDIQGDSRAIGVVDMGADERK